MTGGGCAWWLRKDKKNEENSPEIDTNEEAEPMCIQKIDIDYVLKKYTGNIGFVQFAMTIISALTLPASIIFPVFGNTELTHRCKMNDTVEEFFASQFNDSTSQTTHTFDLIASLIGPWPSNNSTSWDGVKFGCERFKNPPILQFSNITQLETTACDNGYAYLKTPDQYPGGIAAEWNLVCDDAWKVPFSTSIYMWGMMFGFVFGGIAGDRFGRRSAALAACIIESLMVIAVPLSPSYWFYILFRVILAFSSSIKLTVLQVLCMEMTTAHQRSLINAVWATIQSFLLRAILSPLAIWLPDWRWLHAIHSCLSILSFPLIFLYPESPRWLASQHQSSKALHELYKVYRVNQRLQLCKERSPLISEQQFTQAIQHEACLIEAKECPRPGDGQNGCTQLCKTFVNRRMARVTVQCILLFAGELAVCFGLLFYGTSIRANIYLVSFLNSATNIPGVIISFLMYRYCKRRKMPIIVMYLLTIVILACATIYNLVVKPETDLVLNICSNLALVLVCAGLNMVFMYVPELFPSEARAQGLGLASGLGRIGGVLCPFINSLDTISFHGFPIIIYGSILVLELINLAWIPNTSGKNLPDNVEEEEEEEEETKNKPAWGSTLEELVASTHLIHADLEFHKTK